MTFIRFCNRPFGLTVKKKNVFEPFIEMKNLWTKLTIFVINQCKLIYNAKESYIFEG